MSRFYASGRRDAGASARPTRTVLSMAQGLLAGIQGAIERARAAVSAVRGGETSVTFTPIETAEATDDELEDIIFTPLDPDAALVHNHTVESRKKSDEIDLFCPVTRQRLKPGDKIYQCRQCHMAFSAEGWEFLRAMDGGRCCGCHQMKTVVPFIPSVREEGRGKREE